MTEVAEELRRLGHEVFDNWFAAGPEADDYWMKYERQRGHSYAEALRSPEARHVFEFDKRWLEWADTVVMLLPAGKSAWGELMWAVGRGKKGYALITEEPERFDVMLQFADGWFNDIRALEEAMNADELGRYASY